MEVNSPVVNVVMTTYNHEKYIAESINSVLNQTFTDFELIIVNDGSTDKTDEIIRSFSDNRIIYISQENQGLSTAANNGIFVAKGKYIALFSGDDVCYPERLERQYNYLYTTGNKIVFSWVDFIDDDGYFITEEHFAQNYFNHPNRNRAEIINQFFMKGNYLCAVTAFMEKKILLEAGLFNLASIQQQDFDMWTKLIKKYDICILQTKLVNYRIRNETNNLSHPVNSVRSMFEGYQIYKDVLDGIPIDIFKEAFHENIRKHDFQEGTEYELEKAFLYLDHKFSLIRSIGVEKLFNLLQNQVVLSVAKTKYGFGLPELYSLTQNTDITNSRPLQQTQIELDSSQTQLQQTQLKLQQTQIELDSSQTQLQQTQIELDSSQTQLQQTQLKLQQTQIELDSSQTQLQQTQLKLQQTQIELDSSQTQLQQTQLKLQQTQIELDSSQTQLQQTQLKLQQTHVFLDSSQSHLQQTQIQFQQNQAELKYFQLKLQQTQVKLNFSQKTIEAMESSKFWKMRDAWFKLKRQIGLKGDE